MQTYVHQRNEQQIDVPDLVNVRNADEERKHDELPLHSNILHSHLDRLWNLTSVKSAIPCTGALSQGQGNLPGVVLGQGDTRHRGRCARKMPACLHGQSHASALPPYLCRPFRLTNGTYLLQYAPGPRAGLRAKQALLQVLQRKGAQAERSAICCLL